MTHEEAMNDDFQVPNGFLPSDKKQSTMTQNTQGGIARREKALEILNKNIGAEVLGTFGETDTQWIIDAMIEFKELDESPLPASPEGTEWSQQFEESFKQFIFDLNKRRLEYTDTEFATVIAQYIHANLFVPMMANYNNARDLLHDANNDRGRQFDEIKSLKQENERHKEYALFVRNQRDELKQDNERLKEELEDSITFSKKAIEIATDEMAKLKSQLAEAREALRQAEAGLEFAGADKQIPDDDFVPTPTLALRAVRSALK